MPIKLNGEYATSVEVAAILGCNPSYVKKLLSQKKIQGEKLQRDWLIPLVDGKPVFTQETRSELP